MLHASETQTRLDVGAIRGLTPLVGRDAEVAFLRERWTQVQDGLGQVVLLNGEPGIGKSRLVQVLKEQVAGERYTRIEYRCAALYPTQCLVPRHHASGAGPGLSRDDTPDDKLPQAGTAAGPLCLAPPRHRAAPRGPVVAAAARARSPLTLTPQRQRQKTLEALLAWLLAEATRQPVLFIVEDLHWIDPSTLELLTLLMAQEPTARLLTVLTCRPEFHPPWPLRAHVTLLTLSRLTHPQAAQMMRRMTGDRPLPVEIVQQIVAKTDGVPLFVEELTKTVLESGLLREREDRYEPTGPLPPLAIPATLHDSLMARLDRLAPVKAVAQLGAVLGRTFAYELLQAVTPLDEASLQQALAQLVDAELLYQRGLPPQATYTFKHALIQDAAYRVPPAQHAATVPSAHCPDPRGAVHGDGRDAPRAAGAALYRGGPRRAGGEVLVSSGPARTTSARRMWKRISHLTKGLEVLTTLPDTRRAPPARAGLADHPRPGVGGDQGACRPGNGTRLYAGASAVPAGGGDPAALPSVGGPGAFFISIEGRSRPRGSWESRCSAWPSVSTIQQASRHAHIMLGNALYFLREWDAARTHLEQGIAFYSAQQHRSQGVLIETTSGGLWPHPSRPGPVVSGLSGPGPAAEPRGADPGPRAGAPLQFG